jgi:hypothetical protein
MKEFNQLVTSSITPFGSYCYVTMPFDLKNVGATYQWCMLRCFRDLIGQIIEAYVDDIVVKSKQVEQLVADLEQTCARLQASNVRLNPEKCVFGVPRVILPGFIISEHDIESDSKKIAAITKIGSIQNLMGVQSVTGCLAALSRFISRLGEQGLPLYRLLRKTDHFPWTPEAQEALDKLKALLSKALILVPPSDGEPLVLYITATTQLVSTALFIEREEEGHALKVECPMYFVSEILADAKTRYPQIQKFPYALMIAKQKLRHYFESHPVTVVTSFPLARLCATRTPPGG